MLWYHRWLCRILRSSPHIPDHVAFIMDGNRRYAKQCQVATLQGHTKGYDKLKETLEWCLELGVRMVTVYAFSTDNFKRTPEEVEQLMRLAKEKFMEMIDRLDIIHRHGCCVRVLGNIALLPADVREAMLGAVESSRHNTRVVLNICMSYTHQQEMTDAQQLIAHGLEEGIIHREDVNTNLFQSCLYTGISAEMTTTALSAAASSSQHTEAASSSAAAPSCPSSSTPAISGVPDILLRTSGETRLSDFLLTQVCDDTQLVFLSTLWPEFSFYELGRVILEYQTIAGNVQQKRIKRKLLEEKEQLRADEQEALKQLRQEREREEETIHPEDLQGELYDEASIRSPYPTSLALRLSTSSSSSTSSSPSEGIGASSITTSEDSNSDDASDDSIDLDTNHHSISNSSSSSSSPPTSQSPALEPTKEPIKSQSEQRRAHYWAQAEQAVSSLLHQRTQTNKESNSLLSSSTKDAEHLTSIDPVEVAERVKELQLARQRRLRAFALYAQQHTTSLI